MNNLIHVATTELVRFLSAHLPAISDEWWEKHVVDRLSFQQQRMVQERNYSGLEQLDLAALLRVLDQNWFELSVSLRLPREGRHWVKELQTVRNKWAHASISETPASENFRDADTLGRLLEMLDAEEASLATVENAKSVALAAMTPNATIRETKEGERTSPKPAASEGFGSPTPGGPLFNCGDMVTLHSDPNVVFAVIAVIPGEAECRYTVLQDQAKQTYYESQLRAAPAPDTARDVLDIRKLHSHLTSLHLLSPSTAILFSLRSGRVEFVPYQYRPVLKLIRADRPRLLIADEVGVGKTIEAGLILKELRARMDIESVLVICPKALVAERKWYSEMKRFNESFTALDGPLLRHCLQETHLEGEWPEQYAKAILPFSLFDSDLVFGGQGRGRKKKQGLLALDPPPKFDLVIVDEAHHIRNPQTYLHQGIRYFCDNAQAVLLMTATPVQLDSSDLFILLNVLRPDLVIDRNSFAQMSEPNRHINAAIRCCRKADPDWNDQVHGYLDKVTKTEWGRLFLREAPVFQSLYDRLREDGLDHRDRVEIIHKLEGLYTFSGLINRTRRRDIGDFTTRKPDTLTIDFTPDQKRLHDDLLNVVAGILARCHGQQNVKFMMTTIRRQTASCLYGLAPLLEDMLNGKLSQLEVMEASDSGDEIDLSFVEDVRSEIESILDHARKLDPHDPKVKAFVKVLQDKSAMENNKALVFSTFRHTLGYLAAHVEKAGVRYGLVHGGIDHDDRAEIRRRFALPKNAPEAIDILLSSEVGCEGLDFQFCNFLINYDLPWNPMKIEQRIGRIDRYGQKSEAVAIKNFVTPGTVDADIYERCLLRIGVFEHAVGGSEEILGTVTKEIRNIAESFSLTPEERARQLQQLADNQIRRINEERELEEKQAQLFGLNIPNQAWEDEISEADSFWLSPSSIKGAVATYLADRLETETDHILGDRPLKTLRLSQEARNRLLEDYRRLPRSIEPVAREWEKWLKGGQPTLAVTFDQDAAAENPKAVHLSVVHPLVRQAARHLDLDEPGFCSVSVKSETVAPGAYLFAIYRWSMRGIKPDQSLVAVCGDATVEASLFLLLQKATDADATDLPSRREFDGLDALHHRKWAAAKGDHADENRLVVEHRIQSLKVSHRARCGAIEEQISRATDDKISLMRKSELARANADFKRKVAELQQAKNAADVTASPVVLGILTVNGRTDT